MAISKEKLETLSKRMEKLGIYEEDLVEKFILGSGKGGQKVNKTHSCVYLKHVSSNEEIKCQKGRSREMNRYYARKELCERIEEKLFKEKSERQKERDKIRRQKKRRSRKQQQKVLEEKKKHKEKKQLRKPPKFED